MKEKYYDLAFIEARKKSVDLLNQLKRQEQLDKIYSKFETNTDYAKPKEISFHC